MAEKCPDCGKPTYRLYTRADGSTYYACTSCGRKDFGAKDVDRKKQAKEKFDDARIDFGVMGLTKKAKAKAAGKMAIAGTKYAAEATGAADVGREVYSDVKKVGRKTKVLFTDWIKAIIWGGAGGAAVPVNGWLLVTMLISTIPGLALPFVSYYYNRSFGPYLTWATEGMTDFWWWWWYVPVCIVIFIVLGILSVWLAVARGTEPMSFGPGLSKGMFIASIALGITNFLVFPGINWAAGYMHLDEMWCPPGVPLCQASREVDKVGEYQSLKIDDSNIKEKWTESGKTFRGKVILENQNPLDPDKEDLYTIKNIVVSIKDEDGNRLDEYEDGGWCSEYYPCDLKPQEKKEVGIQIPEGGLICSEAKLKRAEETEKVLYEDKKLIIEVEYLVELESKKQFDISRTEKDRSAMELPICTVSPGPIDLCLSFDEDRYPIYSTYTPRLVAPGGFLKIVSAQELLKNPVSPTMYVSLTNKMRGDGRFQDIRVRQEGGKDYLLELEECDGVELGQCDDEICVKGDSEEFTIEFKDDFILSAGRPTEAFQTGVYGNLRDIFCEFDIDFDLSEDEPTVSFEFVGFSDYTYIDKKDTVTGIYCPAPKEVKSI